MNAPNLDANQTQKINETFKAQQGHALALRKTTYKQRLETLERFAFVLEKHRAEMYAAAQQDFSKSEAEVDLTEIFAIQAELKHTRKHLKKWMKPRRAGLTLAALGTSSYVKTEPKGTTLIVSPWNYPFNLSFCPLISALAAGNTAIIKPSELTPNMSAVIHRIVAEAFERHEVAVFEGDSAVASYLTNLPFDHIFFTGSPAVGKHVMAAAAKNLTSVTLELGGKSPTIVDASADIKKAARDIVWGKFTNNGQTCIAPDYLFVHEDVKDDFVIAVNKRIEKSFGEKDKQRTSEAYCRIVNERHYRRVKDLLQGAISSGATLHAGGASDDAERYIAPTVLEGMAGDADILEQEIFGPLLPILTYDNINEVIGYINAKPKPLALYLFSRNKDVIDQVLTETSAGDTCINHNLLHFLQMNLPFGGVNNSGIGKSHGEWGYKAFSHERSVLRDYFNSTHLLFPPYTASKKKLIKLAGKWLT